ncbi:uncharacterized protein LOC127162614 [Labeo rohita]|uniref:uncharacterized protein LOC127162614 n=1 Tax=Labeo rohita TaxID=84645 RepID=UPI0021E30242|nr:uncharacterized protein LOC127162614 [Labeo rohita]
MELRNITKAYYLKPEKTLSGCVSLIDLKLICASKNHSTENNPLNVKEDPESKQHAHEENYVNKADTEDEEEDESNCSYMDCVLDNVGRETNKGEQKAILILHNSSGIYRIESHGTAMEQIHHDEHECKKEFILNMLEDGNSHLDVKNSQLELKGNQGSSVYVSGNINLFSVTLKALGPEDDLDEEKVCKPLLPKSVVSEDQELSTSRISLLEKQKRSRRFCAPIQKEMKTDDPVQVESQDLLFVCSSDLGSRTEYDTMSGYMMTHTGNMHEQNRSLSEGTDCDTDYITR